MRNLITRLYIWATAYPPQITLTPQEEAQTFAILRETNIREADYPHFMQHYGRMVRIANTARDEFDAG